MYAFDDKGQRPICLIPEATAVVQELYKGGWEQAKRKPVRVFYLCRCYRYERPQTGRYREFFQFGVEILGGKPAETTTEALEIFEALLELSGIPYEIRSAVKRGLDYYVDDGFEAECSLLGAQKQIAGGGRYETGVGFALGVDRILLAQTLI
jgi:histidyl-tRNA synthetase